MTENTAVYIRGLAFKCRGGTRREQVLQHLKTADESNSSERWWISLVLALLAGFTFGVLAGYWGIV